MRNILGTAYSTLGNIYTGLQEYFVKPQPSFIEDKLLKQIQACCYQKENIGKIHDAIEKVQKQFQQLEGGVLTFEQQREEKSLMELNGTVPVPYKSKVYPIKVKVFIPQGYPKETPMIRIINLDPQNLVVNSIYQPGRSSSDYNSYILINLNTFQNWNPQYYDICSLINQSITQLSKNFPFKRKVSSSSTNSKQKFKHVVKHLPPQLIQYQRMCQSFVSKTQSQLNHVSIPCLSRSQDLQIYNDILNSQIVSLQSNLASIKQFVRCKQSLYQNISLLDFVVTEGTNTTLINLVSENLTLEEDLQFLDKKFTQKQIDFQQFIKMVRRIEQQRFKVRLGIKWALENQLR